MQQTLDKINAFLLKHQWCDFEIIEMKGKIRIGGKTGFANEYDLVITFTEVFFMQLLYEWKTDTQINSFVIPGMEEQRTININYGIEQGHQLFKIIAEDIEAPMYISSKDIQVEFAAK